ncbi:V-type ATP synthase subunit A [Pseudonocardia broussonetiae]|uniref:V-type ATP synthase alpha chain n=1 Tax=Pseudonocardia broussonetiae TaxID=2736640 RepID=A0A6M6JVV9_9PSEU|nr:V-type ATP synthase subunit A [Pseudonocardia broussonetiae]QJY51146.1 V-type ATP synthase subunit A [Pseudonocardia broussonetiae]
MTVTPLPHRAPPAPAPPGRVVSVSGPVVTAQDLPGVRLFDVLRVGHDRLTAEVVRLDGPTVTAQVFEDTSGLRIGDPVVSTGGALRVQLGPGLLGGIVDGTGRPLGAIADLAGGPFIPRGTDPPTLDPDREWDFRPAVAVGDEVGPGTVLGTVAEGAAVEHRVLLPPDRTGGTVTAVRAGPATVHDPVVEVDGEAVTMASRWPVRDPRPVARRLRLDRPLLTGQRVLDVLFPVAVGGAAVIPGGFGTGKTVTEQALAKHSAADVVVYVGCGERGNEITEVLEEFPELDDPRTGAPLMERTVLVANTSNMPVAAREASIYVGITIAEYFRDQGYDVALMADSTSRWGEALREVSTRLEEIPAEDGYPAYLAARLAAFYERAGRVECLGGGGTGGGDAPLQGSVTLVGAVSPAGGDFSEPITQNSLRLAGTFWALDTSLARSRHYPAVNWNRSYSQYPVTDWFAHHIDPEWGELRAWALERLQEETTLTEIVQLLGEESLAPEQRLALRTGRMLREDFLQQSSFDPVDAACPPEKSIAIVRLLRTAHLAMVDAQRRGTAVAAVVTAPVLGELAAAKRWPPEETAQRAEALDRRLRQAFTALDPDTADPDPAGPDATSSSPADTPADPEDLP